MQQNIAYTDSFGTSTISHTAQRNEYDKYDNDFDITHLTE